MRRRYRLVLPPDVFGDGRAWVAGGIVTVLLLALAVALLA